MREKSYFSEKVGQKTLLNVVDLTSPQSVATSFFYGLYTGNIQAATELILPDYRHDFRNTLALGTPKIPDNPSIIIKQYNSRAEATIEGTGIGIDLRRQGDRWFVIK